MYIDIDFVLFQPPIVILNVVVIEAENLEAKDANGMSNYCNVCVLNHCNHPSKHLKSINQFTNIL